MKSIPVALATAALLGALAGAGGCADNRASIQIQSVCAPPDDCTFGDGGCDATYLSWPTLDVGASTRDTLTLYLQVENQLPDNGDAATYRTDTNGAHVDETVIEYEGVALPPVAIGSNFYIQSESVTVVKVEVIPDALNATTVLAAYAPTADPRELLATIRMRGYLDDDSRFETGEFPVTVRVCTGCVGSCGAGISTCPPDSDGQLPLVCMAP